jgi:hypoxanthine phosphoribosyltransferase
MASQPIIILDRDEGYELDKLALPEKYKPFLSKVLVPGGLVDNRIERMAQDVHRDYGNGEALRMLVTLKGADTFFNDFRRHFSALCSNGSTHPGPMKYDFIRASSYTNDASTGQVQLGLGGLESIAGQHVIVFEDILDTGLTLKRLTDSLKEMNPASLKVAALLVKRLDETRMKGRFEPDYAGFSIPDEFVVGCGLDYNSFFRDLTHICVINQRGIDEFRQSR